MKRVQVVRRLQVWARSATRTSAQVGIRAVGLVLALAALPATVGAAQDPVAGSEGGAPPSAPKVGCLHGSPLPACQSFWVVELQASTPLVSPKRRAGVEPYRFLVDEGGTVYEWNVGHMANLDARWALGGTVSVGSGAEDLFTGVRARVRRWVGENVSVEFEAGLARSDGNHSWYPSQTGVSAGMRFNIQDYGSAFLRYDGYGEPPAQSWMEPGAGPEGGARHLLRGGVGIGGKAALVGTGVVAVAFGVLYGLFLGSGGWT